MLSDTTRATLADTIVTRLRDAGYSATALGDGAFAFDYEGFEIIGCVQEDCTVSLLRYDDDGEPAADVDDVGVSASAILHAARSL